jgi:hypothetical protein
VRVSPCLVRLAVLTRTYTPARFTLLALLEGVGLVTTALPTVGNGRYHLPCEASAHVVPTGDLKQLESPWAVAGRGPRV